MRSGVCWAIWVKSRSWCRIGRSGAWVTDWGAGWGAGSECGEADGLLVPANQSSRLLVESIK